MSKKKIAELKATIDILKDTNEYYKERIECLTRIIYDNMSYGEIKKINEDAEYNEMTGWEFLVENLDKEYEFLDSPSLD